MKKNNSDINRIWYKEQADCWEKALPVGNGRLGGMVYGGIEEERISLNDDTLWSGFPRDVNNAQAALHLQEIRNCVFTGEYKEAQEITEKTMLGPWNESYMPLGDIYFTFSGLSDINEYERELDLNTAVTKTSFRSGECRHVREVFSTAADQVLVFRTVCDKPGNINTTIFMSSLLQHGSIIQDNSVLVMSGRCPSHVEPNYVYGCKEPVIYDPDGNDRAMKFEVRACITCKGGKVGKSCNSIHVEGADELTVMISAATSYNGFNHVPGPDGSDQSALCRGFLNEAIQKSYDQLKRDHIQDYQKLFNRVDLFLGTSGKEILPTDERLERFRKGEADPSVFALLFQFGRYLLISSSRKGAQPANLQGIWNSELRPPWSSNWTTNINAQMNYWPAESCNLSECHEPFFNMMEELRETGSRTAQINYNCRGWVVNHNVDLWRSPTAVGGSAKWAVWPMGAVWMCQHVWEHYAFTCDIEFLDKRAFPLMKDAALFCLDWLVEDRQGKMVTCPSISPENAFVTERGEVCSVGAASTADISMIRQLFTNCIQACSLLGKDKDFKSELENMISRLPSFRVGKYGQLQEWHEDFEEQDPGHRHVSHLFGLYPGNLICKDTVPEIVDACRKTLERRLENGGGYTGWSCAWLVCLFARLMEPEKAYESMKNLLVNLVYTNLFDMHPPLTQEEHLIFQIDGNFGITAGIAELLLQSHNGYLQLLPALPQAWEEGSVKGLCARGGYVVDMEWSGHKLIKATIHSKGDGRCSVCYSGKRIEFDVQSGGIYSIKT